MKTERTTAVTRMWHLPQHSSFYNNTSISKSMQY